MATTYDTDAKAIVAISKAALSLGDNDVDFIGGYDPDRYEEVALKKGGKKGVWVGWIRWYNIHEGTDSTSLIADQYAVNVRLRDTFEQLLVDAKTVRDALNGIEFIVDDVRRKTRCLDGFALLDSDAEMKTIQFFVDVH